MEMSSCLPMSICRKCEKGVTSVVSFIRLCKESARKWTHLTEALSDVQYQKKRNIYFLIQGDHVDLLHDYGYRASIPSEQRLEKFRKRLNRNRSKKRKAFDTKAQCPECKKPFDQISKLNRHMKTFRKKMCTYCKRIFHVKDFEKHLTLHNVKVYSCSICFKTFESLTHYERHKLVCRRRQYECIQCNQSFPNHLKLKLHLPIHNMKTCPICNTVISNQSCYMHHAKLCNTKSRPKGSPSGIYTCHHCSKDYKTKEVLRIHIHNVHMYGHRYQCDKCGKKFMSKHHLEEHENSHNKILDRYICNVCGAKFSTRRGYGKHVSNKGHTGGLQDNASLKVVPNKIGGGASELQLLRCTICKQDFAYNKSLKKHLMSKHNIPDWQIVVCDE